MRIKLRVIIRCRLSLLCEAYSLEVLLIFMLLAYKLECGIPVTVWLFMQKKEKRNRVSICLSIVEFTKQKL